MGREILVGHDERVGRRAGLLKAAVGFLHEALEGLSEVADRRGIEDGAGDDAAGHEGRGDFDGLRDLGVGVEHSAVGNLSGKADGFDGQLASDLVGVSAGISADFHGGDAGEGADGELTDAPVAPAGREGEGVE